LYFQALVKLKAALEGSWVIKKRSLNFKQL